MHKEVEVRFDEDAYKEYGELQELVAKGKPSKEKPKIDYSSAPAVGMASAQQL